MIRVVVLLVLVLTPLSAAAKLRVFVSMPPIQTFVERVGGDLIRVHSLVGPGHDPHTFEPGPKQISELAGADLFVHVGAPFERAWMTRIRAANPAMPILDASDGIPLMPAQHAASDDDHDHDHGDGDPHIWTSPTLVKHLARNIRDRLRQLDPPHAQQYDDNFAAFAADLDALDRDNRALLEGLPRRKFIVFHPAWGYFAHAYGLEQVAIEHDGKTPGARTLSTLIAEAKRYGIRVVFVQPQFDRRTAERIARDIDGRVVVIDPLAPDYLANLRRVARQIAEALRS